MTELDAVPAVPEEIAQQQPSPTPTPVPEPQSNPAPSLSQLGLQISAPAPTRSPTAQPRGDDLMASANARFKPSDEEKYHAKRFQSAQERIQARMDLDEAYAEKHGPELQKLAESGDARYFDKILDEADNLKIEELKRDYPDMFSGTKSALLGMANAGTFGQLSRIYGLVNAAEGKDYGPAVEEAAETIRLMHKANPAASYAGQFSTYLIPGSPVKALFGRLAALGGKVATPALARIATNQNLLRQIVGGSVGGAVAGAGDGAVRGFLGTDHQDISLDRAAEDGLMSGGIGFGIGVAGPLALAGGRKTVVPVAKAVGGAIADGVEKLSGVSADALRNSKPGFLSGLLAGSDRREAGDRVAAAAGKESEIAVSIQKQIMREKSAHPEVRLAHQLLDSIPVEVDVSAHIAKLRQIPKNIRPDLKDKGTFTKLAEYADYAENQIRAAGYDPKKVPLSTVRKLLVDDFDDVIDEAVKEGGGFLNPKNLPMHLRTLKLETRNLRRLVSDTAQAQGGEAGAEYVALMGKAAKKAALGQYILKKIGNDAEEGGARLMRNLFGKSNEVALSRLKKLDSLYGTNMAEKAEAAYHARQLGGAGAPTATPGWLPTQSTGRAALGAVAGGYVADRANQLEGVNPMLKTVGGVLGGGIALASSPRMARKILGSSDKITGFVTALFQQPNALAQMAGVPVKGAKAGPVKVPEDVRRIAREVYDTFKKDGPLSAASTVRLIADTPYFMPFVHYHEVASRKSQGREAAERIAKQPAPGGAQPTR